MNTMIVTVTYIYVTVIIDCYSVHHQQTHNHYHVGASWAVYAEYTLVVDVRGNLISILEHFLLKRSAELKIATMNNECQLIPIDVGKYAAISTVISYGKPFRGGTIINAVIRVMYDAPGVIRQIQLNLTSIAKITIQTIHWLAQNNGLHELVCH
jgi:hypothetical protein